MNANSRIKLCFYFAAFIFVIMALTACIMAAIALFLFRYGHLNYTEGKPFYPFILLLFVSVAIGTTISFFVAGKILKPVTMFGKASNEVAKGNFDVRLEETSKIEEIRDMARNFNIMVQELSGIETLRNDFVVNVSHEFKTPIAAIEGYAMLLQDKGLSEEEREEYTQMIIESSSQLASLSGNILKMSKLENQEMILEKEPFRLDEQIRQAILFLETEWSVKNLGLHLDLPKVTFVGSPKLLIIVWQNLIGNAIKFSDNGGAIGLQLSATASHIMLKITDNGCGMSPMVVKHAFDKFYQGDTARKSAGNGLGLALTKRIVDLCKGEIIIDSKEHLGTVITVILPCHEASANPA